MKLRSLKKLSFTFLCLVVPPVLAWNLTGHVVVAQIAYDNLNPHTKQVANQLAQNIYQKLPTNIQSKLDDRYPNASLFAKVAVLPDVWHKWRAITIFQKFEGILPDNLKQYAYTSTASWHYIDNPYPSNHYCQMDDSPNIIQILKAIKYDLPITQDENTKALLMVYIEHLVGDIHQPLHNITNVADGCGGDRGGNAQCLKYGINGKCRFNLHSLWDKAGGYLKPHANIQSNAYYLQLVYPRSTFTKQLSKDACADWSQESYQFADTVYKVQNQLYPMTLYYFNAQNIATRQLTLAGYRLADVLNATL